MGREIVGTALVGVLLLTGCGLSDDVSAEPAPASTLRPPTRTPAATSASTSERPMSKPPVRRSSPPKKYGVKGLAAAPCRLLDSHDQRALGTIGAGTPGSGDDGTHTCLWLVQGGFTVGVWVDEDRVPAAMPGHRSRVRGHRVLQFRGEGGAVCYTAANVGKRSIVITTDADNAPRQRTKICKVGRKVVAKMLTHVR